MGSKSQSSAQVDSFRQSSAFEESAANAVGSTKTTGMPCSVK